MPGSAARLVLRVPSASRPQQCDAASPNLCCRRQQAGNQFKAGQAGPACGVPGPCSSSRACVVSGRLARCCRQGQCVLWRPRVGVVVRVPGMRLRGVSHLCRAQLCPGAGAEGCQSLHNSHDSILCSHWQEGPRDLGPGCLCGNQGLSQKNSGEGRSFFGRCCFLVLLGTCIHRHDSAGARMVSGCCHSLHVDLR